MPHHTIAAIAVAGALIAVPAPAATANPCAKPQQYGAGAGADLVKLGLLDLRPLGLPLGPVADVRLASTRSGMAADARVNSAAAARYLDAKVLGVTLPAGPLSTSVYQEAPPRNEKPVTAHAGRKHLGVVTVGAGDLTAYATWRGGMACGARTGEVTRSSATVAGAEVLPGPGGTALVRVPANLRSRTGTALVRDGGVVRSVATASAGLADIRLFAGTPTEITVKVIKAPALTVGTGGSAGTTTVEYASPVLQVSGPGIGSRRIDAPGESLDLGLPSSTAGRDAAKARANAERLPLVSGDPLAEAIGALHPERLRDATARQNAGPLTLPALPSLPGPGEALAGALLPALGGELSLVRLSIGDVQKEVTDHSVRAQAASLRLQVISPRTRPDEQEAVVDLAIGMLDAAALAPRPASHPDDPGTPPGGGGGLPVTGRNMGIVAAAGLLLLIAGGSSVMATRRHRTG